MGKELLELERQLLAGLLLSLLSGLWRLLEKRLRAGVIVLGPRRGLDQGSPAGQILLLLLCLCRLLQKQLLMGLILSLFPTVLRLGVL
jgi:hypothetical protein